MNVNIKQSLLSISLRDASGASTPLLASLRTHNQNGSHPS
jgi:hypothetical protein